jgi:hypothetical protein
LIFHGLLAKSWWKITVNPHVVEQHEMKSRQTRRDTDAPLLMAEHAIVESRKLIDSIRSSDSAYQVDMERMRKSLEISWRVIREIRAR